MPSTHSNARQARSERLEARITRKQKELFRQAADIQGRTVTDFVIQAASDAAVRVVQDQKVMVLTAEEQVKFAKALLHPPKPGLRLRAAARRYRKVAGE